MTDRLDSRFTLQQQSMANNKGTSQVSHNHHHHHHHDTRRWQVHCCLCNDSAGHTQVPESTTRPSAKVLLQCCIAAPQRQGELWPHHRPYIGQAETLS